MSRTDDSEDAVVVDEPVARGTNVRSAGEDIAARTEVFCARMLLAPAHVGVLASLGIESLLV